MFCEKCNYLTTEKRCPLCGNKKLREASGEDFCFYVNLSVYDFEMFEYTLKENKIDVVGVPFYPYGVTRSNAGRAGGRKVYIRYKDLDKTSEIYETVFGSGE